MVENTAAASAEAPPPVEPAAPAATGSTAAAMPFILLTVLIDMVAIGLIIPVLPALVGGFAGSQADQALWYGVVTFSFGFANFVAAPVLGALSDAHGRRPVLLLGFAGFALNFLVTAMASSLWMLVAARLVGGALQANTAVAHAYVADITPPAQRARRFGLLGAMTGLGFIIGPVLGGLLGAIHLQLPFYVAGVLALCNLAYGYFVLPESLTRGDRKAFNGRQAHPMHTLRALLALRRMGPLVGVVVFGALAQFMTYTCWVLYNSFKFGWGPFENGLSMAVVGIVAVLAQAAVLPRLLQRHAPQQLAIAGLASSVVAYVAMGAATAGWMMLAIVVLNVLGNTVGPVVQGMVSSSADQRAQGSTMGAIASVNSLMAVLAPVIGAPLLGLVSPLPPGDWRIGAPFYFCAMLQMGALAMAWKHGRARQG